MTGNRSKLVALILAAISMALILGCGRNSNFRDILNRELAATKSAATEKNLLKTIRDDPKSSSAHLKLGNYYQQQQRWTEAEQQLRQVIEIDPKKPAAYTSLASVLMAQGKRDDAEQVLMRAKHAMADVPEGYTLLAKFYVLTNDLPHALDEYASLFQQHPSDEGVLKSYIQVLVFANNVDQAAKLNEQLLKQYPHDIDGLILQGQLLNAEGQPDVALRSLQAALSKDPQNPGVHYALGITLAGIGNTTSAVSELQQAVHLNPKMILAYRALGEIGLRKNDAQLLRQSADGLLSAEPGSQEGYLMKANAELATKNSNGAEIDLQRAINLAPDNSLGYVALGHLRIIQKRFDEASVLFEDALVKNPSDLQALGAVVQLLLNKNEPSEALARINRQITKLPDNAALYGLRGQVQMAIKDYAAAEQSFTKALALNPNNMDAMLSLTRAQVAKGSIDQAIRSCRQLIRQNPREVRAYLVLGSLEQLKNNWSEAEQEYSKVLVLQPENAPAANDLAYLLLEHGGNIDLAVSLAQKAHRHAPGPAEADTLAWAYVKKGELGPAVDLLQEAINASPNEPTLHYHLGVAYQKNHDTENARAQFERALQLNPTRTEIDQIRKALAEIVGG